MWMSLQACRGSVWSLPHPSSVTCMYLEQLAQMKKWPQIRLLIVWMGGLEKYGHLWVSIVHGSWDLYRTDLFCAHITIRLVLPHPWILSPPITITILTVRLRLQMWQNQILAKCTMPKSDNGIMHYADIWKSTFLPLLYFEYFCCCVTKLFRFFPIFLQNCFLAFVTACVFFST